MGKTNSKAAATVSVEIPVDESWVEFCVKFNDMFLTSHSGYWAYGVALEGKEGGWLVFEQGAEDRRPTDEEEDTALAAHEAGKPLPEHWFLLDRAMAVKAFGEGFKRRGALWYEDGDASDYDCALQMAMLGEIRYG